MLKGNNSYHRVILLLAAPIAPIAPTTANTSIIVRIPIALAANSDPTAPPAPIANLTPSVISANATNAAYAPIATNTTCIIKRVISSFSGPSSTIVPWSSRPLAFSVLFPSSRMLI